VTGHDLLPLLRDISDRLDDDVSLGALSRRAGWSPFHLHRSFHEHTGETTKQYVLRLRLERAAALLASSTQSLQAIAQATGFRSQEVFTRAFRRRYGRTPSSCRKRILNAAHPPDRRTHATLLTTVGPCIGLYHRSSAHIPSAPMPTLSISRRDVPEQPILFVRSRIARHDIARTIGESLGQTFSHAIATSVVIAGRPFARYVSTGPGLLTIDVGVPIAAAYAGAGEIQAGTLQGGPAAVALHGGQYDTLSESYAAMERWIDANGFTTGGAPWELYLNDPAEHPDPAEWRTEIYWPLQKLGAA
jgi:AraC family transcriptional regulator